MALDFSKINQSPARGGEALHMLITSCLSGANHTAWTNGGSNDGSGNPVTTGGTGAGGMSNTGAWRWITDTTGRSFLFVYGGTGMVAIYYSPSATFNIAGAGNARPTAADEQLVFGESNGGGGGVPYGKLFNKDDGGYYFHAVTNNNAFWFVGVEPGTGRTVGGGWYEPMQANTYSASDLDPVLMSFTRSSTTDPQSMMDVFDNDLLRQVGLEADRDMGCFSVPNLALVESLFAEGTSGPRAFVRAGMTGAKMVSMPALPLMAAPLFMNNLSEVMGFEIFNISRKDGTCPSLTGGKTNLAAVQNGDIIQVNLQNGSKSRNTSYTFTANAPSLGTVLAGMRAAASDDFTVDADADGRIIINVTNKDYAGSDASLQVSGNAATNLGFGQGMRAAGGASKTVLDGVIEGLSARLDYYKNIPDVQARQAFGINSLHKIVGVTFTGIMKSLVAPRGAGTDPHDGKDHPVPIIYGRPVAAGYPCLKGWSTLTAWSTRLHRNGDTIVITANTDVRVAFDDVLFPWKTDGTVPLV